MSSRFTLRQLTIFSEVMRTGQIRGAAENLHLTHAAVSHALKQLAESLDVELFEPQGRAIVPTPAAQRLWALSSGPQAQLAALPAQLHGFDGDALAGPIHIAASTTIAQYLLPPLLAKLSLRYPDLTITLYSGNTAKIERLVADNQVELGFIEGPPQNSKITSQHWQNDRLIIIGPVDSPAEITPNDLNQQRWISRETGSGTQAVFEQTLALAGIEVPQASIETDSSNAQIQLVAAGAGMACVSEAVAKPAIQAGQVSVVTLKGCQFLRPLWIICPRKPSQALLTNHLKELLRY